MFRTVVAVIMTAAIVGVAGLLLMPFVAAQGSPSAERSFDGITVEPGEDVQVTIAVSNYGGAGAISEMLPSGFTYKTSSLTRRGSGQELRFILTGQSSLTYTVTASSVEDDYTFTGVLKRVGEPDFRIGGASSVTVQTAETPAPSAIRSFNGITVEPGEDVQVTIAVSNYGGAGAISEMLPSGFTYKTSSLTRRGSGQELRFILTGQSSLTYTVTASSVEGDHTFSGVLKRVGEKDFTIGGASSVTVQTAETPTPQPTPSGNAAPVFRSAAAVSVEENTTEVATVRATDRDRQDTVTRYAIRGGADSGKFSIVAATGELSFTTAPDFENPADAGGNNEYMVAVRATSGAGGRARTATQTILVTVTDVTTGNAEGDAYDANENGVIEGPEVIQAVDDYFDDIITVDAVLEVVDLYFDGSPS